MTDPDPRDAAPTYPAETPPASGPDQAPVVVAPPTAPGRPAGLARWGIALVVLALVVGVVSVALAVLAGGSAASTLQGWLPGTTIAYVEARPDLPGDQRAKVGDILAKFPGFADQSTLDAKIDEALDRLLERSGTSWTKDVKPWFGGAVGYAITSAILDAARADMASGMPAAKMPPDGLVVLVSVKDAATARAWIGGSLGGSQSTEQYGGGDLVRVTDGEAAGAAFAIRGAVLIVGPEKAVKAALDTGGKSELASSTSFSAARKSAPDAYLGFGYLDLTAVIDAALEVSDGTAGAPSQACLDQVRAGIPAWAAGSARAETNAIVFEGNGPATGTAGSASASAIAARLPSDVVAAAEVRDLGPGIVKWLDGLRSTLACDPSASDAIGQLDQALAALGGAEALVGWAGDAAVALEPSGGSFGGGLAAVVTDEAAAGRAVQQLQSMLALAGSGAGLTVRTEAYGAGTLLVVTLPAGAVDLPVPDLGATVQGGVFAVGTVDFVKHVVDTTRASSLASAARYTRAIAAAGGDGTADLYVDLAGLRAVIEASMPADQKDKYETEVKPFLEPLEAFASVMKGPGSTIFGRAVLTFTP